MKQSSFAIKYVRSFLLILILSCAPVFLFAQVPNMMNLLNPAPTPSLDDSLGVVDYRATLKTMDGEILAFDSMKGKVLFRSLMGYYLCSLHTRAPWPSAPLRNTTRGVGSFFNDLSGQKCRTSSGVFRQQ